MGRAEKCKLKINSVWDHSIGVSMKNWKTSLRNNTENDEKKLLQSSTHAVLLRETKLFDAKSKMKKYLLPYYDRRLSPHLSRC